MIKIKKRKRNERLKLNIFSNFHRFRDESRRKTAWQVFATKARERTMRLWTRRTWKKHCIAIR
jgi:hypothetical protein